MERPNQSDTRLLSSALETRLFSDSKKLAIGKALLLLAGVLSAAASAQSGASKEAVRCRGVCLQIKRDVGKGDQQDVEVYIENRSPENASVTDLGFSLSPAATQLAEKHQYEYYSPVNIELGIPIFPLPDGAFPESSIVLPAHQSIHRHFKMTELYWTDGHAPIRYGRWESAVPNGTYRVTAEVVSGSRKVSSGWLLLTKATE